MDNDPRLPVLAHHYLCPRKVYGPPTPCGCNPVPDERDGLRVGDTVTVNGREGTVVRFTTVPCDLVVDFGSRFPHDVGTVCRKHADVLPAASGG